MYILFNKIIIRTPLKPINYFQNFLSKSNDAGNSLNEINNFNIKKTYNIYFSDLFENIKKILNLTFDKKSILNIFISHHIDYEKIKKVLTINNINKKFIFIIKNYRDITYFAKIVSMLNITDYNYKPYYNKKNIAFFRDNVFLSKQDIFETKQSLKQIYKKALVNTKYFGNIVIKNNGDIFADINDDKIGNINSFSFEKTVKKAMENGKSWLLTRNDVMPCKNCIYNLLCPPLSGYEKELGINNLCKLKY